MDLLKVVNQKTVYILDYIANRNYTGNNRKKDDLYYAFIDFKKAYDSINRRKLIEVLIKFKINPLIISLIIQMYEGDRTTIQLGKMKSTIEVTSGIRQGCSISTLLFKMVTFTIIEELNEKAKKYKKGEFEGNSLWLADDATIIASSIENLLEALEVLKTAGRENGLELNKEKTKIMVVRGQKVKGKIGDYEVEDEVEYLGIQLGGKGKNIFWGRK